MMAIMQEGNSEEVPKEFLETGRTGRRNAMPDIMHPPGAEATTADLPSRLEQLATTDEECLQTRPQPSTSKTNTQCQTEETQAKSDSCS